jgi:hypothetical protein
MLGKDDATELLLTPFAVELTYDELDTNAANFRLQDGYFSIQTSVYLEDDDLLNEPFLELNNQSQAQCGSIERVTFGDAHLVIKLEDSSPFLEKYRSIRLLLHDGISKELVDFFSNHLFLGDHVTYEDRFDKSKIVAPIAVREPL